MKKVLIVWAWPWWISAWMILSSRWYDVEIFEKQSDVWGRNNNITLWNYKFDIGPTFLIYKKALDDVFELSGRKVEDYLEILDIDPLYKLSFDDGKLFYPRAKIEDTYEEIARVFPGEQDNYLKYIEKEGKKFEAMIPCLEVPYSNIWAFLSKRFLKALPKLDLFNSLHSRLSSYFTDERLKISMAFQAKYIGMSPWTCPAAFTILSYFEHKFGIHHVKWGLNQISKAMAKVIKENNGKINLNTSVKKIIVEKWVAKWVLLENWETIYWDHVIVNADFAYAMTDLIDNDARKKYTDEKLKQKEYSCSTFMLYLWLDKKYENLNHHNIIFNKEYKQFVDNIGKNMDISDDFSFYVHNPSLLDNTLAPEWESALYILIPTPNNVSWIDWETKKEKIENKIYEYIEKRFGINDIREHTKEKLIITPNDWENKYNIYNWATFNLSHKISQMLYFRPHNKSEDIQNMYLVWWWTHPGSGLPTIYESAMISTKILIESDENK